MSFSKGNRFRDNARSPVPSSQNYQTVGEPMISPNRDSLSGTTFGASSRPVLSDTNHTVQGKLAGFASHRTLGSLSPRPGPGTHARDTPGSSIDKLGRNVWLEMRSPVMLEEDRLKAKINLLNLRLAGDVSCESTSSKKLQKRRNDLCRTVKSLDSLDGSQRVSFTYSFDESSFMKSSPVNSNAKKWSTVESPTAIRKFSTLRPKTAV